MEHIAREVWVEGLVQGVGFRHFTKLRARALGLCGYVRNLDDGRVEVCAEGERAAVEALVHWLHAGPPSARVARVEVRDGTLSGAQRFEVRR